MVKLWSKLPENINIIYRPKSHKIERYFFSKNSLIEFCQFYQLQWIDRWDEKLSFLSYTLLRRFQDIVRGRLGCAPCGRRDSSAQITTIETSLEDFCCGAGHHGPNCGQSGGVLGQGGPAGGDSSTRGTAGSKRRRSSLAQLTDLLRDLGSAKDKYRQAVERGKLFYTFFAVPHDMRVPGFGCSRNPCQST